MASSRIGGRVPVRLLLLGLVVLAVLGPVASAQEDGRVVIRSVDVSDFPAVTIEIQLAGPDPGRNAFSLREAGRLVRIDRVVPVERDITSVAVVLAIDTSGSMANNDAIGQARLAAQTFVDRARPADSIGLISFNTFASELTAPTTDHDLVRGSIDTLEADGFTALWDAIILGSQMLDDAETDERYLVVMSDIDAESYDNASQGTAADATAAARAAGVSVLAVGLPLGPVDDRELRTVIDGTGGLLVYASDATQLDSLFGELQASLRTGYELQFQSGLEPGASAELLLTVGASQTTAELVTPTGEAVDDDGFVSIRDDGGLPVPLIVGGVVVLALLAVVVVRRRAG